MKRTKRIFVAFWAVLGIFCNTNTQIIANATSDNPIVYTPNGSSVSVMHFEEWSEAEMNARITECTTISPCKDAVLLANPTTMYNCHSYAWYSQDTSTNTYWMSDPSQYYTDGSYYEVETPRAGDIICYFDDNGTTTTSDDINLHSGIVTSVNSSQVNNICGKASLVNVTSKWGGHGLFYHRGDICPYVSTYSGKADYVKFYRPRTQAAYSLSSTMTSLSLSRTVSGSGSVTSTYGMYELNITEAGRYTFTISSDDDLDNRLYNIHMNQIQMTLLSSEEGTYIYDFYLSAGIYYLRVAYADTTNSGTISINIKPHMHSYNQWTYYTNGTHIESCCCGKTGTATAVHAVKESAIVNNKANCLGCGYLLDLTSDIAQTMPYKIVQMSVNGSYILSNGIVVLVDKDLEAYQNGTLVFYNSNALPMTD